MPERGRPVEVRAGRAIEPDQVGDVLLAVRGVAPGAARREELEDDEQFDRRYAHPRPFHGLVERGSKQGVVVPADQVDRKIRDPEGGAELGGIEGAELLLSSGR
jgi:hypothetical protein